MISKYRLYTTNNFLSGRNHNRSLHRRRSAAWQRRVVTKKSLFLLAVALFMLCSLSFIMPANAARCVISVVKDTCWQNYNVTVRVFDAMSDKQPLVNVLIPARSQWARQNFECHPSQALRFEAQFTPVFWESDRGRIYEGRMHWTLPSKLREGETTWHIPLCYPRDFSEVPFPPDADGNCKCTMDVLPPVRG